MDKGLLSVHGPGQSSAIASPRSSPRGIAARRPRVLPALCCASRCLTRASSRAFSCAVSATRWIWSSAARNSSTVGLSPSSLSLSSLSSTLMHCRHGELGQRPGPSGCPLHSRKTRACFPFPLDQDSRSGVVTLILLVEGGSWAPEGLESCCWAGAGSDSGNWNRQAARGI